jgi:hypothetical protein
MPKLSNNYQTTDQLNNLDHVDTKNIKQEKTAIQTTSKSRTIAVTTNDKKSLATQPTTVVNVKLKKRNISTASPSEIINNDLDTEISNEFLSFFNKIELILHHEPFAVANFLSGRDFNANKINSTKVQLDQVVYLVNKLTEKLNIPLTDLLKNYKIISGKHHYLQKYDFLIRTAILVASENSGAGIKSWQAYTKTDAFTPNDANFWPWLENIKNWIPEVQGAAAKFTEYNLIKALILAKDTEKAMVIAYKGGFGAGKTSHGKESFGYVDTGVDKIPKFSGAISPDASKDIVRRGLPEISHDTAHIQGSNLAYNIFNGLIALRSIVMPSSEDKLQKQAIGSVVYDSSLAYHSDIKDLIKKSSSVDKSCKIIEIARYDVARSLAVLARKVDGKDPRIPLSFVMRGANNDRKYRAECMNAIIESNSLKNVADNTVIKHQYDFNCSDSTGTDTKLVCTLTSGERPLWHINKAEAITRLTNLGLKYDESQNKFFNINPEEKWEDVLQQKLQNKISDLIKTLSPEEEALREKEFKSRILPFSLNNKATSIKDLYNSLSDNFKQCIDIKSFSDAFNRNLNASELSALINKFNNLIINKQTISYMDLPATVALDLHSKLTNTPNIWKLN